MPLTPHNFFKCDLLTEKGEPDCDVNFYYDSGGPNRPPPNWPDGIKVALTKVVAVTHPLTGHTKFFCSDGHAIEAIKRGQHIPPIPQELPRLTPSATDADVKEVARQAKAVEGIKVVGKAQ
jgi:hypothetical protein